MATSSSPKLCCELISSAFQRCRVSKQLCRVSIVLIKSSLPNHSVVQISISSSRSSYCWRFKFQPVSDTGVGSCLEEFYDLKFVYDFISSGKWDGLLSIKTTSFSDKEIYNYKVNLRENDSNGALIELPSNLKNGVMFSGTEVCLSISESMDVLVSDINSFLQKMVVLNIPNIATELVVEQEGVPGSQYKNIFPAIEENALTFPASTINHLQSGLEDYVLKHGNKLNQKCDSCFPSREQLKVGTASCSSESCKTFGLTMETVIFVTEAETTCSSDSYSSETEVMYYENFEPSSIGQSSISALSSVDWKSYGLTLARVMDQDGYFLLQWENLQANVHVAMVLHCYDKQHPEVSSKRKKTQPERSLVRKVVTLAMNNLKERHPGLLLSKHALNIRNYAPDLARSIAGLITSSIDQGFQKECLSLLDLQYDQIGAGSVVEECIREKIISVIEVNDRNPMKSKNMAAPSLFEDALFRQDSDHETANGNGISFSLEDEDEDDLLGVQAYEHELENDEDGEDYAYME